MEFSQEQEAAFVMTYDNVFSKAKKD